jgi:hypothetical protein
MSFELSLISGLNSWFRIIKPIIRKTIGFSKKITFLYNHEIYCTHFNFRRDHRELTKEKDNGCIEKNTPAKKYGITKSKWAIKKLLNYRCIKISTN